MSKPDTRRDSKSKQVRCGECPVRQLCLPDHLGEEQVAYLEQALTRVGPLAPGESLHRSGDHLRHIHALFAGTAKSRWSDRDGREHIAAFHLPGDLLGADALQEGRHLWDVVAVDTAYVCRFDNRELEGIAQNVPGVREQMLRLLSRELTELERTGPSPAAGRLGAFLTEWSERLAVRGNSRTYFVLSMTRRELANHLALTPESLSRAFRKLQDDGLIAVDEREVRILDGNRLASL